MLESPLSTSFSAMVRCMVGSNGLSRQASSMHQAQLARAADRRDDLLQRHRLGFGVMVGREPGVDRHQIVDPADFEAMAGVIHHRPIGLFRLARERMQRVEELVAGEIVGQRHGLEADVAQGLGDQLGVARRIVELLHVLVGAVADDQRDAARPRVVPAPAACGVSAASRSRASFRACAVSSSS